MARRYPDFPVILETYRECLRDVLDLSGLEEVLGRLHRRELSVVEVETATASPFASSLLFDYVATYMYEGDTPNAERRAAALSLDRELLRELLGQDELRELIDADALATVEDDLQHRSERTRAATRDALHDVLRRLGDLDRDEIAARVLAGVDAAGMLDALERERRAIRLRLAGDERWVAAEDAGLYRDALGAMPPGGLPEAFLEDVPDALRKLASRYARTHGPFTTGELRGRYGVDPEPALRELERADALVRGELRPGGSEREWCDAEVLRRLRRASLAALRKEIEPADERAFARFLPSWQGVDRHPPGGAGPDRLREVLVPLQGLALPVEAWEKDVLPRRVGAWSPTWLDQLCSAGELVWVGAGAIGRRSGRVALYFREDAPLLGAPKRPDPSATEDHEAIRARLRAGACFFTDLLADVPLDPAMLQEALWDLVWAGRVSNDTFAPLRALAGSGSGTHRTRRTTPRARPVRAGVRPPPPTTTGRWAILPDVDPDPTRRAHATAERMLERYGVVTRGAVMSERSTGGFAAVYKVLSAFEESGRCRRGYFVEGLGAAQFGTAGAIDRLRTFTDPAGDGGDAKPEAVTLAATDPANPFGSALPWPERETSGGHRPGRKAGALVVLVDGALTLYVERGGRTLLTWSDDAALLRPAALSLSEAGRRGALGRITVEKADGEQILGGGSTPLREALDAAGFVSTPRGLRLRG